MENIVKYQTISETEHEENGKSGTSNENQRKMTKVEFI